jgi:hypothetical protein
MEISLAFVENDRITDISENFYNLLVQEFGVRKEKSDLTLYDINPNYVPGETPVYSKPPYTVKFRKINEFLFRPDEMALVIEEARENRPRTAAFTSVESSQFPPSSRLINS